MVLKILGKSHLRLIHTPRSYGRSIKRYSSKGLFKPKECLRIFLSFYLSVRPLTPLQQIHQNPELGFQEKLAHDNITSMLEALGFSVTRHAYGLDTSFLAEYGNGGRVVAFNAEYGKKSIISHI